MTKALLLAALSLLCMAFGVSFPTSAECTGTVKWNGSIPSPKYLWILNADGTINFCPSVTCDTSNTCRLYTIVPSPGGYYKDYCSCNDIGKTCTTMVYSLTEHGPISLVTCYQEAPCSGTLVCDLRPYGNPDPNGYRTVKCTCQ
jgi:hypothetical protein